jgi:hypothetical protein
MNSTVTTVRLSFSLCLRTLAVSPGLPTSLADLPLHVTWVLVSATEISNSSGPATAGVGVDRVGVAFSSTFSRLIVCGERPV